MTNELQIAAITTWFFDRINVPVIEGLYIDDAMIWDALCASLTILGDLQRAKSEYLELQSINHLEAIGIMQAIYIEQDCMLNLQNALMGKIDKTPLPLYKSIRDLRNEAFGHPSERKKKGIFSRHFFDIADKERQLVKIINWEGDGDIKGTHVALPQIVEENSRITIDYLQNLQQEFIAKIKLQMKSYQIELTGIFKGANYIFEKLLSKKHDRIVIDSFNHIDEDIQTAVEGLKERKLLEIYQRDIDVIKFFSDKLKPLFNIQTYEDVEFYAYAISLRRELDALKKSFKNIEPDL